MTDEKFKIPVIRKRSDLEKVAQGDEVMFNLTTNRSSVPTYGIISFIGKTHVALIHQVNILNPEFGEVAWKLYGFSKVGNKIISRGYGYRFPFRVGSEEYENYKSRLTKLRELRDSDKLDFVELK